MRRVEKTLRNIQSYLWSDAEQNLKLKCINESFYHCICESLTDKLDELHKITPASTEDCLLATHYTSIDVLISMLKNVVDDTSGSFLRLYDSVCLNDPDEGKYLLRTLLPDLPSWIHSDIRHCAYLASFVSPDDNSSRDMADNLVFWRTYGDEGQGCSISFCVPSERLRRVVYGDASDGFEEAKKRIHSIVDLLDLLKPNDLPELLQRELNSVFWKALRPILYLYKSNAYDYENELRVVLAKPADLDRRNINFEYLKHPKYPSMPSYVRHYLNEEDLEIKNLLISGSSITIGPRVLYPDNLQLYIEDLLKRAGLLIPIKLSRISYRQF